MRHRKAGRKLGRTAAHRKAMLRNMVTSLFEHERIVTTVPKAKEVKPQNTGNTVDGLSTNVWRCPVCGYLCAKDQPPPKCPICGVSKERFELFIKAG